MLSRFHGPAARSPDRCQVCHGRQLGEALEATAEAAAVAGRLAAQPLWGRGSAVRFAAAPRVADDGGSCGTQVGEESRSCLNCHDGTVAGAMDTRAHVNNNHPVGVPYVERSGYRRADRVKGAGLRLVGDPDCRRVECTTCHNPHEQQQRAMLRLDNAGSALCLACHDK